MSKPTMTVIERIRETVEREDAARDAEAAVLDRLTSYTLADAIREGSSVTRQAVGRFGAGEEACALSAGMLAAMARGYIEEET